MKMAGELADLESANSLLGWDQETTMPPRGVAGRSMVASTMAGILHDRLTEPALRDGLRSLNADGDGLGDLERAQIRELFRIHDRAARIPRDLVQALAEHESKATALWAEARTNRDFKSFAPCLEEEYRLKRAVAEAVGYEDDLYDALLDEYEPGARIKDVFAVLEEVRDFLIPLVGKIVDSGKTGQSTLTAGPFDPAKQDALGRELIAAMGFDMKAGRLDVSNHPFTSGIHGGDTRLTTRYKEDLSVGLFGTLHETGHGLYEQNLAAEFHRTPLGPATSLGIHESQSRLWENNVGRGRAFWTAFFPRVRALFPERLGSASADDFYRAVNSVSPSLIRIEADEVTYNLHIVIRVELERELLAGTLKVKDLPEAWNTKFRRYLGIVPPTPDVGVLQDIHWAVGYIGYFATYTLGNLYAAMFYEAARRDIPDLEDGIARGELIPLRDWLVENVHRWGRRRSPAELAREACGKAFSAGDFKAYVTRKFGELYGV
jgi:carboxypeptidase Taq